MTKPKSQKAWVLIDNYDNSIVGTWYAPLWYKMGECYTKEMLMAKFELLVDRTCGDYHVEYWDLIRPKKEYVKDKRSGRKPDKENLKLLPCPWCGDVPEIESGICQTPNDLAYRVRYYKWDCLVNPCASWRISKESAIEIWNTRK